MLQRAAFPRSRVIIPRIPWTLFVASAAMPAFALFQLLTVASTESTAVPYPAPKSWTHAWPYDATNAVVVAATTTRHGIQPFTAAAW